MSLSTPKIVSTKMSSDCEQENLPPHVLIFPLPGQGHLNSMLNLAHIFCLAQFHVTFIVSEFSRRRLLEHSTVPAAFASYPGFQLRALPDGLPDDHPRAGETIMDIFPAVKNVMVPSFKNMMIEEDFLASASRRRVTCFVADGSLSFAVDFAEEKGIPLVYFRTATAAYFWTLFCYPQLLEAQEIPFGEDSMDVLVKSIPATEGFLRRRDLPSFFRVDDVINDPNLKTLANAATQFVRSQAAIFNTSEDLEGPIISQIQKHMPRTYSIGPIHQQLKSRLTEKSAAAAASITTASLWAEDRSCLDWLKAQPRQSVLYVSFGSITVLTREQLLEFWHGLVNSSQRFLWVMRPDSVAGNDGTLDELMENSKEKGLLVEWAPQEEVLNHPAVGGFLTHCGWNSTLESIAAGVPMICWPYFGDQTTNSRFVSEVWKMGLDIKDRCDRLIIENAVREVMEVRKEEFLERAGDMARHVKRAVCEGGSSYSNMDALIHYIKSLII